MCGKHQHDVCSFVQHYYFARVYKESTGGFDVNKMSFRLINDENAPEKHSRALSLNFLCSDQIESEVHCKRAEK